MTDKQYLKLAFDQAQKSLEAGGFPAGSVLVKDGKIIARGISIGYELNDPTSHAETSAVRESCKKLATSDLTGSTLYASLQPCLMCFSVSNWAKVSRIVYGCQKTSEMVDKMYYEGLTDISLVNQENNHKIELVYVPDIENEMLKLVKVWEESLPTAS